MENWKAIYLFLKKKKNLFIQIHRGSLEYFFLQLVCFSKVILEVLPIWLRKTGAPISAITALTVAWKPSPPTNATRSCWCFSRAPLFASLAYREGRQGDEWDFICPAGWLIQQEFPTQNSCLSWFIAPTFIFQSLGRFPLTISCHLALKSQKINNKTSFFLSEISHSCTQFTLGTRLKGRGFETWSAK